MCSKSKAFFLFLSIFLFFISFAFSAQSHQERVDLLFPPEASVPLNIESEMNLLFAKGLFEVSGVPSSFAIAWVDSMNNSRTDLPGWNGIIEKDRSSNVLNIALFEESNISLIRQISDDVDASARIFLRKEGSRIAVVWKGSRVWNLGLIDAERNESNKDLQDNRSDELSGISSLSVLRLAAGAHPLAFSMHGGKATLLMSPGQHKAVSSQDEQNRKRDYSNGERNLARVSDVIFPESDAPVLFEIDLTSREAKMLYRFPGSLTSASLSSRGENWTVAATETDSKNLQYIEITPNGKIAELQVMNSYPVKDASIVLKELEGGSAAGWIEGKPSKDAALLGLLTRGEAGSMYISKELLNSNNDVKQILLSEGKGLWVIWSEESEGKNLLKVMAFDLTGEPVCLFEAGLDSSIERIWLLEEGKNALLFRERKVANEKATLTVQDVSCDEIEESVRRNIQQEEIVSLDQVRSLFAENQMKGSESPLGGAEDPCDGYDNDSDGTIDEGCDTTCNNPGKWGQDERISENYESSYNPSLTWTGSEYAVAWHDYRDGNNEIYFARIDSSGNRISSEIRVTNNSSSSSGPSIIWTGSEYGIAWMDDRDGNNEVYFTRMDASGAKIGSDIRVTSNSSTSSGTSLVWNGSGYGLSWQDDRDGNHEIYFVRLNSSGTKIGSDVRLTSDSANSWYPSLIWTGAEYGVTWEDNRSANYEIFFTRISSTGNKIGSDIRVTSDANISEYPDLVWTGSEYGVTWHDYRDGNAEIYLCRLNSTGTKIGSDVRVTSAPSISVYPSISWSGTEYGISWDDYRDGDEEIYFARLSSLGSKIGSDVRLTNRAERSMVPSLVWTGSEYGVSWTDERNGGYPHQEIYFARINCCDDADGDGYTECAGDSNDADPGINPGAPEVCDGYDNDSDGSIDEGCDSLCDNPQKSGSDLRVTSNSAFSSEPSLVWTGSEYGASWYDERDGNGEIYFARLNSAGNKLGSDIRLTSDSSNSDLPSLIWTGSEYGVSWQDHRDGNYEIYFVRLDPAGTKVGNDVRVTSNDSNSWQPSLVWTGSGYGAGWVDTRDGNNEIYFARLDPSGNKVGSDVRVTSDPSNGYEPSLAWAGNQYGVSWYDTRDGNNEIYFARLDSFGNKVGSDVRVTSNSSGSYRPSLVWTGSEFGVGWADTRDGNNENYFARLDPSGNKVGSDVRVTNNSSVSYEPSLVWTGSEYGMSRYDNFDGNYEIYFTTLRCCDDADGDGFTECAGDSNDSDPSVHPGAAEICDGKDNDSDGSVDEGCDSICDNAEKLGPDVRLTFDWSGNPSLVWTGSVYGVSWEDNRDGNNEIYFARLDSSGGKIGTDVRVTNNSALSWLTSLVWTGSGYGISWEDNRDGNYEIYFTRLDSAGNKIGPDVRVTHDSLQSHEPTLVWTGSGYGVSWQDNREETYEIFFARLNAMGIKIGSDVRVTWNPANSQHPSLVWSGGEYGISWSDYRDGNAEVYFTRLDSAGNKISADVRVTNDPSGSYELSSVWTGNEYGISWRDDRNGNNEIYFARLNALGSKIGSDVRVTTNSAFSEYPSLVWTGSEYGVSWRDDRDGNYEIYIARIDSTGNKISTDMRMTNNSSGSYEPSLTWTGSEYGVSWEDNRSGPSEIFFSKLRCCDDVDSDTYTECGGDCNDFNPFVYPGATENCDGIDNDCDATIDEGCDTSIDNPGLNGSDVPLTPNDGNDSFYSSMDWNSGGAGFLQGGEYGIAWEDDQDGNYEIYFARLDENGNMVGDDIRITYNDANSLRPELKWNGSKYGLTWYDDRNGNFEIYFVTLDAYGTKLTTDVRITNALGESSFPSLIWSRNVFALSWQDARDHTLGSGYYEIYFARLDQNGNKIGSDMRVTNELSIKRDPSLGWNGTDYGVAWEDDRDGNFEIYYAHLDANGNKIGSDVRETNAEGDSVNPSLLWGPGRYGLAWQDNMTIAGKRFFGDDNIMFNDIDSIGDKDDDDVLITDNSSNSRNPSLAWSGSEWGVAFSDDRDGNQEIYFACMYPDGTEKGDEVRITNASNVSDYPTLVWNGEDYGSSWQDLRNTSSYEVYFARISDCVDHDSDTYTQCAGDCNDADSSINPGATELCDDIDNDCDGTVDDGFATPGGTTGLHFNSNNKEVMSWDVVVPADRYDVVKGDLALLRSSSGDFTSSLTECRENDSIDTQTTDTNNPSANGQGFYYLVRAQNCWSKGTYNTGLSGQIGNRDTEIEASSNKCP